MRLPTIALWPPQKELSLLKKSDWEQIYLR
jgi:hypothetical protein